MLIKHRPEPLNWLKAFAALHEPKARKIPSPIILQAQRDPDTQSCTIISHSGPCFPKPRARKFEPVPANYKEKKNTSRTICATFQNAIRELGVILLAGLVARLQWPFGWNLGEEVTLVKPTSQAIANCWELITNSQMASYQVPWLPPDNDFSALV